MSSSGKRKPCEHDQVVLCFKEGWFCMDCRQIVDHDCGYKETRYRYGITGYRVDSKIGHKYATKYVRKGSRQ